MILVTGGSGFVGSAVLAEASRNSSFKVRAAVRRYVALPDNVEQVQVSDLTANTDWSRALSGVDVIIHAAARVHVMRDSAVDPLAEFRRINVGGTLNLASQAAASGVKRFIFISSIKVNGEGTLPGHPYTADDTPAPVDPYGVSKHEAEEGLRRLAKDTGMEVVIIRPVLVYGPGVKGNFLSMIRCLSRGIPLPLGAIHNRRSLVARDNLVNLIMTCVQHPAAANQTFLVSDGEDISTTSLLRRLSVAMGKRAHLIPVPSRMLLAVASLLGRSDFAQRLCGSLQVDIGKTRDILGWQPVISVDAALKQVVI